MMEMQRLRIVCISDTHNQTPKLPPGDILIHAGDLTRQGSASELQKIFEWLDNADFKAKIVVAGNHDRGLDKGFQQEGRHAQTKEQVQANIDLFTSSSNIHYLQHESRVIRLPNGDGTEVWFKVFGSPYSPKHSKWAFGYNPSEALELWQSIPLDADIVVTHTPAKYHVDEAHGTTAAGCDRLRGALWRVRPRLFVCGHVHEARGAEVVEWDLETASVSFKERSITHIQDNTSGDRQFCIDLSSRSKTPLGNDGSQSDILPLPPRRGPKSVDFWDGTKSSDSDLDLTRGRGGPDSDARVDEEALAGRRGRRQTCIINASYLASSWPYRGRDGKYVNKPIIVDLDLPSVGGKDE